MFRGVGSGPVPPEKIWSSDWLKVGPASTRNQLIEEAAGRARKTAEELLDASEFQQDPSVRTEVLGQFDTGAALNIVLYARALLDQLVTNEETQRRLRLERAEQGYRISALVLSAVLAIVLESTAGIGSGPGGFAGIKTGWRHDIVNIGYWFIALAIGLGIWAAVRASGGHSGDRLREAQKISDQNGSRLRRDVDAALEEKWVRPIVTRVLGDRLKPTFSSQLRVVDVSMFGGSPITPIETRAFSLLNELIAGLDGASIGLCGPRGVGKTTLIRSFCHSAGGGDGRQVIGICVDVPVAYAPRDFLANIYSRLVEEVDLRVVRGRIQRKTPTRRRLLKLGTPFLLILIAAASAAAVAKGWRLSRLHIRMPTHDWQQAAVIATVFVAALLVAFFPALARRKQSRMADAETDPLVRVREYVERGRLNLKAEVVMSSSIGGSAGLPGAGVSRSGTRQVSRGALSYPDLVEEFRNFVERINDADIQTRIGIDELDKLNPDDARSFLNGLKAVFGLPGTHFLVSVSEDAMSDFERRGVPIRDAFDSSLDEVVRIYGLTVEQSMSLLSSQGNYDFPLSFGALCHCFSGGLPRELLRVARLLVRHNARIESDPQYGLMRPLCERLIADDLEAKSYALWVVARGINVEPYTMRFRDWLAKGDENRQSPERLLSSCQAYLDFPTVESGELAKVPEWMPALERLGSLALEFAGYRYFAATVLDFFSQVADIELRRALSVDAGTGSLQTLSSARARFADDPRLAWSLVTQFREAHQINPALPVPAEGWRLPPSQTPPAAERTLV
jgi:GTPase SAR1 family protein